MSLCYKKLWKLLIDRDISRRELQEKAGVSRSTMWKMGRNDYVSLDVITKICKAVDCSVDQIMDIC